MHSCVKGRMNMGIHVVISHTLLSPQCFSESFGAAATDFVAAQIQFQYRTARVCVCVKIGGG